MGTIITILLSVLTAFAIVAASGLLMWIFARPLDRLFDWFMGALERRSKREETTDDRR